MALNNHLRVAYWQSQVRLMKWQYPSGLYQSCNYSFEPLVTGESLGTQKQLENPKILNVGKRGGQENRLAEKAKRLLNENIRVNILVKNSDFGSNNYTPKDKSKCFMPERMTTNFNIIK